MFPYSLDTDRAICLIWSLSPWGSSTSAAAPHCMTQVLNSARPQISKESTTDPSGCSSTRWEGCYIRFLTLWATDLSNRTLTRLASPSLMTPQLPAM